MSTQIPTDVGSIAGGSPIVIETIDMEVNRHLIDVVRIRLFRVLNPTATGTANDGATRTPVHGHHGAISSRRRKSERRRTQQRPERQIERREVAESEETNLKFYLELASPVVDAPSIGPSMATKLEAHGILTVDQLLAADAEHLADKLDHRRIDAETIVAWQEQARLVCRIPNLRGHDAQLLVACDITSPEALSRMNADTVPGTGDGSCTEQGRTADPSRRQGARSL